MFIPPSHHSEHCFVQAVLCRTRDRAVPLIQASAKHGHVFPLCIQVKKTNTTNHNLPPKTNKKSLSSLQISIGNNSSSNNPAIIHHAISIQNSPGFALVKQGVRREDERKNSRFSQTDPSVPLPHRGMPVSLTGCCHTFELSTDG